MHTEDRKMFQVAENDEVFGEFDQVEGDIAGEGRRGKGRERYKKYFWNFKQFKSMAEEWPWVQASCHRLWSEAVRYSVKPNREEESPKPCILLVFIF